MGKTSDWNDEAPGKSLIQREEQLRAWIGGQLRQPGCSVPDPVWDRLVEEGYVGEALGDEEVPLPKKKLLRIARGFLRDFRADTHRMRVRKRRRLGRTTPARDEVEDGINLSACLSKKELKRAEILSRELVRIAEKQPYNGPEPWATPNQPCVAEFRDRVLGGQVISWAEAQPLLKSFGAAMFEFEFFAANGIPVLDHTSELTTGLDWNAADSREGLTPRSEVTFCWGTNTLVAPLGDRAHHVRPSDYPFHFWWRGQERVAAINTYSLIGWLDCLRRIFVYSFPWDGIAATMFVLIGLPPRVVPIDLGIPEYSEGREHVLMRLELTVHPWVSAETVLEVYRRMQRIVVGPRNRLPEVESLEFFDFVSRLRHEGKGFRDALDAWLAEHPRERRRYPKKDKTSLSRFSNQFRDIERQVLRPFGRPDEEEVEL